MLFDLFHYFRPFQLSFAGVENKENPRQTRWNCAINSIAILIKFKVRLDTVRSQNAYDAFIVESWEMKFAYDLGRQPSENKVEMRDAIEAFRGVAVEFRIWLLKASNHNKKASVGQQPSGPSSFYQKCTQNTLAFSFPWSLRPRAVQQVNSFRKFHAKLFIPILGKFSSACSFHHFGWTKKLCDFISGILQKVYRAFKSRKHGCTKNFVSGWKLSWQRKTENWNV